MRRMLKRVQARAYSTAWGLEMVAAGLNALAQMPKGGVEAEAWWMVHSVVSFVGPDPAEPQGKTLLTRRSHPSLSAAAGAFNRMARSIPTRLIVRWRKARGGIEVRPYVDGSKDEACFAAWLLWRFFFQGDGWKRLKRCPQCRTWFVDATRNRTRVFFPDSCKDKYWSRKKRHAAGHRLQPSKREKAQGGRSGKT